MTLGTRYSVDRTAQESCLQSHFPRGQLILGAGSDLHAPTDQIRDGGPKDWGGRLNQVYEYLACVHRHLLILGRQASLRHLQCTREP